MGSKNRILGNYRLGGLALRLGGRATRLGQARRPSAAVLQDPCIKLRGRGPKSYIRKLPIEFDGDSQKQILYIFLPVF